MQLLHTIKEALLHLASPHVCAGCGSDVLDKAYQLCLRCLEALPKTLFHLYDNNPVEKSSGAACPSPMPLHNTILPSKACCNTC